MRKYFVLVAAVMIAGVAVVRAGELTGEEKAFFDKQISDVVKLEPTKLDDPAMTKVFAVPFYHVKIVVNQGDGGDESLEVIVARVGDKFIPVDRPSTDMAALPDFQKMINPDFKLNDDNAKILQKALDSAYPIMMDDDKKVEAVQHKGNKWIFVRGNVGDKKMGYVFETDDSGAIKSISFVFTLP